MILHGPPRRINHGTTSSASLVVTTLVLDTAVDSLVLFLSIGHFRLKMHAQKSLPILVDVSVNAISVQQSNGKEIDLKRNKCKPFQSYPCLNTFVAPSLFYCICSSGNTVVEYGFILIPW